MNEWACAVRMLPKARELSHAALIDHLPALLDKIGEMADELARGSTPGLPTAQAERHAHHRLDEGLDLADLVAEYALLRSCIIRLWGAENPGRGQEDLLILNQAIDTAIMASVERYTEAQSRTFRALDRISTAALESQSLGDLLERLLRVFVETTAAVDTAAILLREDDRLVVRAAVGLEEEVTQGFSIGMGEGFAGKIAAEREPVCLRMATRDPIVQSDVLRAKGVRALYGVPLIEEGEIIGVAHMGSCTAFEFSDQDQRILRAMAQRATAVIAQHRVREEACRVAEILELGDACFVLDADWRIRFVNRNQERLSRKLRTETLGRVFWEVWPEIARPDSKYWTEYHRAMEERAALAFEEYYGPLDLWTSVSVYPTRDGGIAVFFRDATRRKRAEQAAVEARAEAEAARRRWRALFQQAPLPIVLLCGPDLVFEFANPPYEELVGHRPLLGRPVREVFPEAAGEDWLEKLSLVYRTGVAQVDRETRVHIDAGDGCGARERYFNLLYHPYRDARGRIEGVMVVGFEVTDDVVARRRIQGLLRQVELERARLEQILRQLPVGVTIAEPSGRIALQNPAVARIWDLPLEDAENIFEYRLGRLFWPDGAPCEPGALPLARSLRDGVTVNSEEVRILRDDGAWATVSVNAAPIRDREGNIIAGVAVITDITARKEHERRLAEAAEWQERMIGILGHDLRSPVSTIAMAVEAMLLRGDVPAHHARTLARIQSAAYRMGDMISDIVGWTQARLGGGFPVSPRAMELGDLCARIIAELQTAHPGREIVLERRGACQGTWDPERLSQVVQNLIGNALEHGAPGHPVRVSVAGTEERVVLEVHNAGAPIPADAVPRIFEPFLRLDRRPSGGRRSLGLGLYIVREIVRAHGGRVDVRSSAPEGTTFTVTLPRNR